MEAEEKETNKKKKRKKATQRKKLKYVFFERKPTSLYLFFQLLTLQQRIEKQKS